jgi:2-iminobutanoate/2-iminopropanoate deaminase
MNIERLDMHGNPDFTFSTCVRAGDFVYTSHHGGMRDDEGNLINDIEGQTIQTFRNLAKSLEAAGSSLDNTVKTLVLMRNKKDFRKMRDTFRQFFQHGYPVRSTIFTDFLDDGCLVQIDVVAYSPKKHEK